MNVYIFKWNLICMDKKNPTKTCIHIVQMANHRDNFTMHEAISGVLIGIGQDIEKEAI